ncbi:MAG: zinc-binding dehydrogenase, partial [Limisphaerales bacterium]
LIGFLSGGGDLDLVPVIRKAIHLQGIPVGSRRMFEDMNHAIGMNHLKPVIDKTFAFADARQALEYMGTGSNFGKIVIKF